jgi:DEAD/DEAH box helicase domain-containing protein
MRRLRRLCSALGNNTIRFISCTATISNPTEHMQRIFGLSSVQLISTSGSPCGRKEFLCWDPPLLSPSTPSAGRIDSLHEAAKLFTSLLLRGVRTIVFCLVRQSCELVLQSVRTELSRLGRTEVINRIQGYRGGYTPQDRRRIEHEMFSGELLGIVATNALELGIDIGALDAVVMAGFPSTLAAFRQQAGRAGRRNKDSLAVLVGSARPVDQYYVQHPSSLFTAEPAPLTVDLENTPALEGHLQCAAQELPIFPERDEQYFGSFSTAQLVQDETTGFFFPNPRFLPHPASLVTIRQIEEPGYAVVDTTNNRNVILETLEPSRAIFVLYEGGIFLHQGRSYLIKIFSPSSRIAAVEAVNVDWTTSQRDYTDVDPLSTAKTKPVSDTTHAAYGTIRVTTKVFGYFKIDRARRILDAVDVDTPPLVSEHEGVWINLPTECLHQLREHRVNPAAAIHSASHALIHRLPAGLQTECKAPEKEFAKYQSSRKRPARLVMYGEAAGVAWEVVHKAVREAREKVEGCGCDEGCLECCLGERCKEGNAVSSKVGAAVVLRWLLGMGVEEGWWEKVPAEGERGWDKGTVVPVWARKGNMAEMVETAEDAEEGDVERFGNTVV